MEYKGEMVIDTLSIDKDKLTKAIENYHELGYLVKVSCNPVEDKFGSYSYHEYTVKVIKIESY